MIVIEREILCHSPRPRLCAQTHTADEWVEVDQILTAARFYAWMMEGM